MGYNSFIKGGLPLNSYDFVDRENALASKSRLLVAIDKISKLHTKQMQTYDSSTIENNMAVDKTIDTVSSSMNNDSNNLNLESITTQAFDSSPSGLWQAPSITDLPATPAPTPAENQGQVLGNIFDLAKNDPQYQAMQEPMYTNNDVQTPMYTNDSQDPMYINSDPAPMFTNDNPQGYENYSNNDMYGNGEGEYEAMSLPGDAGDPLYVLDEAQVGTRARDKSGKTKVTSNDIKSARFVAWFAYIIFFLPLLFMGKNSFVRHHADNGLCYNIVDAIGVGLIFLDKIPYFQETTNKWVSLAAMLATILGFMIVALMAFIKVVSILLSWAGREVRNPILDKFNIIK